MNNEYFIPNMRELQRRQKQQLFRLSLLWFVIVLVVIIALTLIQLSCQEREEAHPAPAELFSPTGKIYNYFVSFQTTNDPALESLIVSQPYEIAYPEHLTKIEELYGIKIAYYTLLRVDNTPVSPDSSGQAG